MLLTCPYCGDEFERRRRSQRYCSQHCRVRGRKANAGRGAAAHSPYVLPAVRYGTLL